MHPAIKRYTKAWWIGPRNGCRWLRFEAIDFQIDWKLGRFETAFIFKLLNIWPLDNGPKGA